MANKIKNCCSVIYWKHEDGWDVYNKSDCYKINDHYVPCWFDCFIVEDMPSKKMAKKYIDDLHILGICLVKPW